MNAWIETSYAYLLDCIRTQKKWSGANQCIHPDVKLPYGYIDQHIQEYGVWPTIDHFSRKYNINLLKYEKTGHTTQELIDLLKDAYLRDISNDLMAQLNILQTSESVTTTDFYKVLQQGADKVQFTQQSEGHCLTDLAWALKQHKTPKSKIAEFGFSMLDRYTQGIVKGQYTILFGSVSEGKSTFARMLAGNIALQGKKVLYLTLEQNEEDSIVLTAGLQAHFNSLNVFEHKIDAQILKKSESLVKRLKEVGGDVRFIGKVEHKGSLETLLALQKEYQPDVVFLDQITLFTPNGSSDEKDITKVTRMLKSFCQLTEVPMIALTQRLRGEKKKGAKDPDIADLDNIGYAASIGQDADIIIYVHKTDRDGDYKRKKITIAKNRKGKRYIEINYEWDLDKGIIREVEDYTEEEVL